MRLLLIIAAALVIPCLRTSAADAPPPLAERGPKPKPVDQPSPDRIEKSIERGVGLLLELQNKDGSWGSADSSRPGEIYAPVPGAHHAFKAAVTALCISALMEVGGDAPTVGEAIDRGEAWLFDRLPSVRRATPDAFYNTWTHAYGIQTLAKMLGRKPDDAERRDKILDLIDQQLDMLDRFETVGGGWTYYDFLAHTKKPSDAGFSFVTATALVALAEARGAGVKIPQRLVDRATASIRRQRNPDYSYLYGEYLKYRPRRPINRPAGSLGRSQACNLAMRLWGDKTVTDEVLRTWLDRLFARNGWLDIGRKRPIPHESWFGVAGYFFYYGHYYAALCIDQLPLDQRAPFQDQLADRLLALQEKDGSWWDYPLYNYHRQYGTALALMSLGRARRAAAVQAERQPDAS